MTSFLSACAIVEKVGEELWEQLYLFLAYR